MANRKKAEEAAIKFSVETSQPEAPAAKPAAAKKPNPVTASPVLPGLQKTQREAVVPEHPRAASDRAKRQEEIAKGIDEARMPKQNEAEERWKSDRKVYTEADRQAFAARKEAARKKALADYTTTPVSDEEKSRARKASLPKRRFGRGRK